MQAELASEVIAGRYRVVSLLGRGGMGAVYRVQAADGSELALKRLNATSNGTVAAELFEREFHTLSELAHPRIIEVHDYGVDAGGAYYTMELLTGQDFSELGMVDWRTACALLRDVASSLSILHSRRMLHCDVSARNVRCTRDGRAKLLDFGAMMVMGPCRRVVGTPPFIAPEMVQLQALDARTDVYGLGALVYHMLTGRHAYPARKILELRDAWRRTPRAPHELEPSVPLALSELVIECLELNRNARPSSAGVVMERLCAIAGIPLDEGGSSQAYLSTPTLVGRDAPLAAVRKQLVQTPPVGALFWCAGLPGSGRSRMLDACVLEAKLLGWQVLRADAGDASGDYGVARALYEQLFLLAPEATRAAVRIHAKVLVHVLGEELAQQAVVGPRPERKDLLSALRDPLLSVARSLRVMIAVDDVDRIDEPSVALLLALAHKLHRRPLCVVLAAGLAGERSRALEALAELGESIELAPLAQGQTEQLVRSVFGDARNTLTLARHLHAIARGNPRAVMQLLEHLVAQGIARYEAGGFILPERLREEDLPRSQSAAFAGRVAALEPDARELAQLLALTEPGELPSSRYVALGGHGDRARMYRALDQLVSAHVLEPEGEHYRFSDVAFRDALTATLNGEGEGERERRRTLHARLAQVFEPFGSVARRALHLMESEQQEAAVHVLLAQFLRDPLEPRDPLEDYVPGILDLLERAAEAAAALKLPAPLRVELQMKVAGASQFLGDAVRFARVAERLCPQLERESGLVDHRELSELAHPAEPGARLMQALTRAQRRHDSTPEHERGLPPADAIRELARLCAMHSGVAAVSLDVSILERAPALDPLAVLSPAVAAIHAYVRATLALNQGRAQSARAQLRALLTRLEQPDRAGLGELYCKSIRLGALYSIGLIEATVGMPDAGQRVLEHEREPGHRVNAQRVHLLSALMQGDFVEAAAAQRRAELVMLQDGALLRYPNTTARMELHAYAFAEDLAGLKQVLDRVEKAARVWPRWQPVAQLALCHCRRLQGDFAGALTSIEQAIAGTQPLRHRDWGMIAAAHVQVLADCGRSAEAIARGEEYLAICTREGLHGEQPVAHHLAEALLDSGQVDAAFALVERAIADISASGARGLVLGAAYELRARVAIARRDAVEFAHFEQLCAVENKVERNPTLAGRYERLLRAANDVGMLGGERSSAPRASLAAPGTLSVSRNDLASSIHSRLFDRTDPGSRASALLAILAEHSEFEQGFLFGVRAGRVALLASLPDAQPPGELSLQVEQYLARQVDVLDVTQYTEGRPDSAPGVVGAEPSFDLAEALWHDAARPIYPLALMTKREGQLVVAGIAALRFSSEQRRIPPFAVLDAIGAALLEHDDVDAVTCLG